ncbi:TetR/AcrR family transcriptional regulator [Actinomadura hibisca]|uniref:TetR/AcrR family transcriptional regulator n=1 Tax=Actinomadura hibisca TaxID=68565 RepID=UPI00083131D8|nr:TetR/AcrR family transcriptional regulator [Actinomadura hibisca]
MAARPSQPVSVWVRPARNRRDQPTLGRDQIVDAALELLDAEGLTGLSMRRLGAKLNAGATSVYWHVANKDELLELAMDRVMGEVEVPDPEAAGGWRPAAEGYARSLRTMIHRHPWTMTQFGARPLLGPNAARVLEGTLVAFGHAGFTGFRLEYALSLVVDYVIGAAGSESAWMKNQGGQTASEILAELEPYFAAVAGRHPRLAAHAREIWANETAEVLEGRFTFGLESVLDGLEKRVG